MAETDEKARPECEGVEASAPPPAAQDGVELTDEQLDKVAGGFQALSNVMKTRHDTAKNSISNLR